MVINCTFRPGDPDRQPPSSGSAHVAGKVGGEGGEDAWLEAGAEGADGGGVQGGWRRTEVVRVEDMWPGSCGNGSGIRHHGEGEGASLDRAAAVGEVEQVEAKAPGSKGSFDVDTLKMCEIGFRTCLGWSTTCRALSDNLVALRTPPSSSSPSISFSPPILASLASSLLGAKTGGSPCSVPL